MIEMKDAKIPGYVEMARATVWLAPLACWPWQEPAGKMIIGATIRSTNSPHFPIRSGRCDDGITLLTLTTNVGRIWMEEIYLAPAVAAP